VWPSFSHPWALVLLAGIPWWVWRWRQRPRPALRWPDATFFETASSPRATSARLFGTLLRAFGLAAIILGLAGPRWPDPGTRLPVEGIAIQMIVDVSGSMAEPDFNWDGEKISRLKAVKRAFKSFVDLRKQDQIGLVLFATIPETASPLTLDHAALLKQLNDSEPRGVPTESETNIGDAIVWGLDRLQPAGDHRRVMILLSDGEHNVPAPALTPRQAAQLTAAKGIPIYTIFAAGGGDNAPGAASLESVARMTEGESFVASDADGMRAACETIDRLERQPAESFLYLRYFEAFPWCGVAALICFGLATFFDSTILLQSP